MASAMNLGMIISRTARLYPQRIGLVQRDKSWTWRQLNDNVNALSAALGALGVSKGDCVMIQSPNDRYLFEAPYAIYKLGGVSVPVNFRATPVETSYIAKDCHAKAFIAHPDMVDNVIAACDLSPDLRLLIATGPLGETKQRGQYEWLIYDELISQYAGAGDRIVDVNYNDCCWCPYSSGTTGRPKGVILTHGQMAFVLTNKLADVLPGLGANDASLVIVPLSHAGMSTAHCNTIRGAKSVLLSSRHFDEEECWRLIEEHRITNFFAVPTVLMRLVKHPAADKYDHSSLRFVMYAGSPITKEDQKFAFSKLGKALVQYYGSAECMGTVTVLSPDMHSAREGDPMAPLGSCGVVRTGMDVALMDAEGNRLPEYEVGEICVRGPAVSPGYFEKPETNAETFRDGWLRTGDLGRQDERGFLYIVGRAKEMYISGGFNVYPNEIEDYLTRHPAVDQAAVASFPDSKWGEVGVAIVTLLEGTEANESDIAAFLRKQVADYKRPRRIFIVDDIPKSSYGKIPKQLLRETLYERGLVKKGEDIR